MADDADMAGERSEVESMARQRALQARAAKRELLPTERCYFCLEPVARPLLFCDMDCSTMHQMQERAMMRNGR
jgi:hypothetical protein